MVGYKLTENDKDLLPKLLKSLNYNVTDTAKQFCELRGLEYTESSRKRLSKYFIANGITMPINKEVQEKLENDYEIARERELKDSKFYIITWEQNNTPLHKNLFKNILAYKEFLGAELSVILGRYKNPTSVFQDEDYETWNEATKPYWDAQRHDIHKYLTILGDVKIQPTAVNPISGLESITADKTTIVGHPKMWLKTVPVLEGYPKKMVATTGAITLPNYTDSKAGKRGELNHKLGFLIVEIKDEDVFFFRQVEADKNGNFIDLYYEVKDGKVIPNKKSTALVWGDLHCPNFDPRAINATMKLMQDFDVDINVFHDIFDGESVNNHKANNPIEKYLRKSKGEDSLQKEIQQTLDFLHMFEDYQNVIVQANHNDRIDRWLASTDWTKDLENAEMYTELLSKALKGQLKKGALAYIIEKEFDTNVVRCLDYDESFRVNGVELAYHGHLGTNGSRGSLEQYRKLSTKMVIGHSHSPARASDVTVVGTLTPTRVDYTKGASSWGQASCLIHRNGVAQLIIFINGEFSTM